MIWMMNRLHPSGPGAVRPCGARCIVLTVFLMMLPRSAGAYRPFDSTDAAVAGVGELELELGPAGYLRAPGRRFLVAPSFIGNIGFLRNWELVLQGRQLWLLDDVPGEHRSRFVESGILLKGVLREGSLQKRGGLSVGGELGFLPPNVNADKGVGATAAVILSQRSDPLAFHLNGAVTRTRAGNPDVFGGIIVEGPHTWTVRPVAEFFVEKELAVGTIRSALAGAIFHASDSFVFDVAGRAARVVDQNVYEARAGFTWTMRFSEQP
jgi:hypothetical protein